MYGSFSFLLPPLFETCLSKLVAHVTFFGATSMWCAFVPPHCTLLCYTLKFSSIVICIGGDVDASAYLSLQSKSQSIFQLAQLKWLISNSLKYPFNETPLIKHQRSKANMSTLTASIEETIITHEPAAKKTKLTNSREVR